MLGQTKSVDNVTTLAIVLAVVFGSMILPANSARSTPVGPFTLTAPQDGSSSLTVVVTRTDGFGDRDDTRTVKRDTDFGTYLGLDYLHEASAELQGLIDPQLHIDSVSTLFGTGRVDAGEWETGMFDSGSFGGSVEFDRILIVLDPGDDPNDRLRPNVLETLYGTQTFYVDGRVITESGDALPFAVALERLTSQRIGTFDWIVDGVDGPEGFNTLDAFSLTGAEFHTEEFVVGVSGGIEYKLTLAHEFGPLEFFTELPVVVPEPTIALLMGLGLAGLSATKQRSISSALEL